MENHGVIPDHQFGNKHAITEQIHRIVKRINDMEADRYSAVFFDVSQASTSSLLWH